MGQFSNILFNNVCLWFTISFPTVFFPGWKAWYPSQQVFKQFCRQYRWIIGGPAETTGVIIQISHPTVTRYVVSVIQYILKKRKLLCINCFSYIGIMYIFHVIMIYQGRTGSPNRPGIFSIICPCYRTINTNLSWYFGSTYSRLWALTALHGENTLKFDLSRKWHPSQPELSRDLLPPNWWCCHHPEQSGQNLVYGETKYFGTEVKIFQHIGVPSDSL